MKTKTKTKTTDQKQTPDDLRSMKRYFKKLANRRVTESSRIWEKPCFLYSVTLTATGDGVATATLRNGHEETDEAILDLAAQTSSMQQAHFSPPIYFSKGLYADLGENVTSALVHFLPER
jgi:hypothetical protein